MDEAMNVIVDVTASLRSREDVIIEKPLTADELAQREVDAAEAEAVQVQMARMQRGALLAASDWTQVADVPLSEEEVQAWRQYRQALRDAPTGPWPSPPA